jgi:hypothetical protein
MGSPDKCLLNEFHKYAMPLEVAAVNVKTEKGWHESNLSLTQYLEVGDSVDESIADYVLFVLPPAYYTSELLQMGEPFSSVRGEATYITLHRADGIHWKYVGTCHLGSFAAAI